MPFSKTLATSTFHISQEHIGMRIILFSLILGLEHSLLYKLDFIVYGVYLKTMEMYHYPLLVCDWLQTYVFVTFLKVGWLQWIHAFLLSKFLSFLTLFILINRNGSRYVFVHSSNYIVLEIVVLCIWHALPVRHAFYACNNFMFSFNLYNVLGCNSCIPEILFKWCLDLNRCFQWEKICS